MKYYTFLIVVQTSYLWFIHVLWFWAMCKWLNVLAKLCVKNAINVYIFKNALVYKQFPALYVSDVYLNDVKGHLYPVTDTSSDSALHQ